MAARVQCPRRIAARIDHAIKDSDGSGPARGIVMMARVFDPNGMARIAEQTVTSFSLLNAAQRWPSADAVGSFETAGINVQFRETGDGAISVQSDLPVRIGAPFVIEQHHTLRMSTEAATVRWIVALVSTLITILLIGALYLLFIVRKVFTPLRAMHDTIESITANQRLEQRVALPQLPELRGLAQGFNLMMDRLAENDRRITELSLTDEVTGVANRRHLDAQLLHEWQSAIRGRHPLSIVFIDIDYFKKFNDHYGHQAGDVCLRNVARHLVEALRRNTDFVGRYGGEEFMAIFPHTGQTGLSKTTEILLQQIGRAAYPHQASSFNIVTISIGGVTGQPDAESNLQQWIAEADKQLYRSKESGRNRATIVNAPTSLRPDIV